MSLIIKKNGHQVFFLGKISFHQNQPKEATDVRFEYSTLFSLSSNPYCRSIHLCQGQDGSNRHCSRQTIPSSLSPMSQPFSKDSQPIGKSHQRPQLCFDLRLAPLSLSQDFLSFLQAHPDRRPGAVYSLSEGDKKTGLLYSSTLQGADRQRSRRPSEVELEDCQKDRQALPGARVWPDRLPRASYTGCRRDRHPQGAQIPDYSLGLSEWSSGLGGKTPKGFHPDGLLQ